MNRKNIIKNTIGSAYLFVLGIIGVLILIGVTMSQMTVSGRWSTVFASHDKKAEECAEAATNMAFRIVKEQMNNHDSFWTLFKKPKKLLRSWFMHFRLPAPVAQVYTDPVSFNNAVSNGMDVQLDLFNSVIFKPLYKDGIVYIYDTLSPDPKSPLSPLKAMFKALGGRVRVITKARIAKAFAILATKPDYKIPGITVGTQTVKGFLGGLIDKL